MSRFLLNFVYVYSGCFVFMCGSDCLVLVKLMYFVFNIYYCFFYVNIVLWCY